MTNAHIYMTCPTQVLMLVSLDTYLCYYKYNCVIAGHFNCPGIDWVSLKAPKDGSQDSLLDFTVTQGLSQIVQAPTRRDNLLDIILTNEPLSICNVDVIEPFITSDHCQVIFSVFSDCTNHCEERVTKRYDWSNDDYDDMSAFIAGIDWLGILSTHPTADSLWAAFSVLQAAMHRPMRICQ